MSSPNVVILEPGDDNVHDACDMYLYYDELFRNDDVYSSVISAVTKPNVGDAATFQCNRAVQNLFLNRMNDLCATKRCKNYF